MQIKPSFRQWILSAAVFGGILFALASVDARVRDKVGDVWRGADAMTVADRLTDVGSAVTTAIRHQSIDNAPLLLFGVVGAVLFLFMIRT